jgi:hypothetical protein
VSFFPESEIRKISVAQLETEKFPFLIYSSYPQGLEFEMRPVERAKATFYIIKFALPPLKRRRRGRIFL